MKSTYDLLQGKLDQLKHYYELLEGCSLPEKEKELIFLLIQSSLFSDDGFTIDELVAVYDQAKISVRKKLSILKEKNLLNISRQGHALLYRANMQEVEKIKCD